MTHQLIPAIFRALKNATQPTKEEDNVYGYTYETISYLCCKKAQISSFIEL